MMTPCGGCQELHAQVLLLEPRRVALGSRVAMSFALRSRSSEAQDLLVDVAVHFVKAKGIAKPKVFKVKRVVLPPRGRMAFQARFSLAVHTTRAPRPGAHAVDVRVNGQAFRAGSFHVLPMKPAEGGSLHRRAWGRRRGTRLGPRAD